MTKTILLAAAALAALALPAAAATVRLDVSGTVGANNFGLDNGDAYVATALFDTDAAVTGTDVFGERSFAGAVTGFVLTIDGDTVTSTRAGTATQQGSGSSTSSTNLGLVFSDGTLGGSVAGRDARSVSLTFQSSFADMANFFTDPDTLLDRVADLGSVAFGPGTGLFQNVRFAPAAPGGATGFVVLTLDDGALTLQPEPPLPPAIPLPASGVLLIAGLGAVAGLRRRRG